MLIERRGQQLYRGGRIAHPLPADDGHCAAQSQACHQDDDGQYNQEFHQRETAAWGLSLYSLRPHENKLLEHLSDLNCRCYG